MTSSAMASTLVLIAGLFLVVAQLSETTSAESFGWNDNDTLAYHFHTYYFQHNSDSTAAALEFRSQIHRRILSGELADCSINHFNTEPVGPHPIGSFETCCNVTSLTNGVQWFMKNRGAFSILLHGLTREEVKDHTERAAWIGQKLPLDLTPLTPVLDEDPICPQYPYSAAGNKWAP